MKISNVLRKIRLLYGYKLEHVADSLGISTEAYRRKETGQNDPQYNTIVRLAELYKITVVQLITFDVEAIVNKSENISKNAENET